MKILRNLKEIEDLENLERIVISDKFIIRGVKSTLNV